MAKSQKIINDPVYGFIHIKSNLILKIIDHPYYQRLRRISQLGLTDFVYPGAIHTRFHHALGAMYLMELALETLRNKGYSISEEEQESAMIAILLHDIGHGPFSHALEHGLLDQIHHEEMSLLLMQKLNEDFDNQLILAIQIFKGEYERPFFHQLVSSQLDVDRLDYLNRDSFFTGVAEGKVSADRILKMIQLDSQENLAVEEKSIYSIENFLNARRLMYWQVYLHKTVISAEFTLLEAIKRAKHLASKGTQLACTKNFKPFLYEQTNLDRLKNNEDLLACFTSLDDTDIWYSIKAWKDHHDLTLSNLCHSLVNRKIFEVRLSNEKPSAKDVEKLILQLSKKFSISTSEAKKLIIRERITNSAYVNSEKTINILSKSGKTIDISKAVDLPNIKALSKKVKKYFICWPREIIQN